MSYLLFVDESGHDQRDSPYEVLAAITVEDTKLWSLINAVQALEVECFGQRYSDGERELKAKKILKRKVFKHAAQLPPIDPAERVDLARECLINGSAATRAHLTALAQAKIAFVEGALKLCLEYECKAIAILVTRNAPRPSASTVLRKDYAYLLERFYYFLDEQNDHHQGLVVFDELERSQSHLLIDQLARYFTTFTTGAERASRVIPEPFFVHSHLTTGVQLADLIAYIAAWGIQVGSMGSPARPELATLGALVAQLEHHSHPASRARKSPATVHSFYVCDDLRPHSERDPLGPKKKAMRRTAKPPSWKIAPPGSPHKGSGSRNGRSRRGGRSVLGPDGERRGRWHSSAVACAEWQRPRLTSARAVCSPV